MHFGNIIAFHKKNSRSSLESVVPISGVWGAMDVAKNFQTAAKDNPILYVAAKRSVTALDMEKYSSIKWEHEVLFSHDSRMKVIKSGKKARVVNVEIISG